MTTGRWLAVLEEVTESGVARIDAAGRLLDASPGFRRLCRLSDPIAQSTLAALVSERDRSLVGNALDALAGGQSQIVLAVRLAGEGGSDEGGRPVELRLARGAGREGELWAVLADRSAQERVERLLLRSERQRQLGQLALGAAHELNNLLGVILSGIELVRRGDSPATLDVLRGAVDDAARIVERLQSLGRERSDEEPPQPIDPRRLVREVLELTRVRWQNEAQARGAPIRVEARLEPTPPVEARPGELRQALVNLIVNAIDAMAHGGVLGVECREEAEWVVFRVSDTGPGIAEEVLGRIFDPFFSTKGERGLGLGLSLVTAIVRRHGGVLAVDSNPDQGTLFEIRLPRASTREAGLREAPPGYRGGNARGARALRVLLVEDDERLRALLERFLASEGHRVSVAASAEEAERELVREAGFDVVLTDLTLPGRSGLELAAEVRRLALGVPVLLSTAWGVELARETLESCGVREVLHKPFHFARLRRALAEAAGVGLA